MYDPWYYGYGGYYGGYYGGWYGHRYGWYDNPYYYGGIAGPGYRPYGNSVYVPRSYVQNGGNRETRPGSGSNYRYRGTPGSAGGTVVGGGTTTRRSQSGVSTGSGTARSSSSAARSREQGYNPNRSYGSGSSSSRSTRSYSGSSSGSSSRSSGSTSSSSRSSGSYSGGSSTRSSGGGYSGGGGGYSGGGSSSHSGGGGGGSRGGGGQNMYDAINFSQNHYFGTARSMAMGNAVTAVGGDLGSIGINPAGSAVAGYGQFAITPGLTISSVSSAYSPEGENAYGLPNKLTNTRMNLPNVGFTMNYRTGRRTGVKTVTFGIVSTQTNNYNFASDGFGRRSAYLSASNTNSVTSACCGTR